MTIEEQHSTTKNAPRPFVEIPRLWLQLNKMSESFFASEIFHTSTSNTFLGVLVYTLISTTASVVLIVVRSIVNSLTTSSSIQITRIGFAVLFIAGFSLIVAPVAFYMNNGITFVIAQTFGGKGRFDTQTYLASLFVVPLGMISSLLSFVSLVPKIGDYISYILLLGIAVFHIIFTVRSFKVIHGLSSARAVVSAVAPLTLLLIPLCLIGLLMFIVRL